MFIQVIQGYVLDRIDVREALDTWVRDVAPGAEGWLGTTAGVTADNMFIGLARFQSAEAAQHSSHRPEQHEWWMWTSKLFAGEVVFHDCTTTDQFLAGGRDDAGFVKVVQGRATDIDRTFNRGFGESRPAVRPGRVALARQVIQALVQAAPSHRSEVIGGVLAFDARDATVTEALYFTSESAAREVERRQLPSEAAALMAEWRALLSDVRYFDLTQPWLYSPSR